VLQVLKQFRELFRVSQQHFQRIEERCGVSGAQLWALAELDAKPGLKISELAAILSVHVSTASNLLDKLEARQFIRRERAQHDQRVVRVFVTPDGRACMRRAPQPVQGVIIDALHRMPAPALRRLGRDLEILLALASLRNPRAAHRHLSEP
jgi:DNA-binding MarR family transcriptional regulator